MNETTAATSKTGGETELYVILREMQALHNSCVDKARFIENVANGKEKISFAIIDRCREAIMQLHQSRHVFGNMIAQCLAFESYRVMEQTMKPIIEANNAVCAKAEINLHAILEWVPKGPTSRRTDH